MKNIITILTILIVFLTLGLKANNGEPEISQKTRELVNKIDRPQTVIKVLIVPITTEVKVKTANAIQSFINKVKEKHLS
jgi:hypothetical protein